MPNFHNNKLARLRGHCSYYQSCPTSGDVAITTNRLPLGAPTTALGATPSICAVTTRAATAAAIHKQMMLKD